MLPWCLLGRIALPNNGGAILRYFFLSWLDLVHQSVMNIPCLKRLKGVINPSTSNGFQMALYLLEIPGSRHTSLVLVSAQRTLSFLISEPGQVPNVFGLRLFTSMNFKCSFVLSLNYSYIWVNMFVGEWTKGNQSLLPREQATRLYRTVPYHTLPTQC